MAKNDGGPAFPAAGFSLWQDGMSLRDWFAGQALAGMLADYAFGPRVDKAVEAAYRFADAMLAEREKEKGTTEP